MIHRRLTFIPWNASFSLLSTVYLFHRIKGCKKDNLYIRSFSYSKLQSELSVNDIRVSLLYIFLYSAATLQGSRSSPISRVTTSRKRIFDSWSLFYHGPL